MIQLRLDGKERAACPRRAPPGGARVSVGGEHELAARRDLANDWYRQLSAPSKYMYTFADAGHSAAAFQEFQPVYNILTHTILPQTYDPSSRSQ